MKIRIPTNIARTITVALLGAAVAALMSCGSSGTGLIPSSSGGPLQTDFEAVAQAATSGNGSCEATESALGKTEQDFLALPASVDRGLHKRLQEGIANLRKQALVTCAHTTTTATTTTTGTTTTKTTPTTTTTETTPTTTTPTNTTETTPTTTTPTNKGGGTEAPGESEESKAKGESEANGGAGAGGASPGGGQ